MIVIPFKAAHLKKFEVQQAQQDVGETFDSDEEMAVMMEERSKNASYSFALDDGKIIGCAGLMTSECMEFVYAWAIFSDSIKVRDHYRFIRQKCMEFMDSHPAQEARTMVAKDFPKAARWVKSLGFVVDEEHQVTNEQGQEYEMYVRRKS